jgi:hypothetical protein
MRDPSVHAKRSDLIRIFRELGLDESRINDVMREAMKCSIRNRVNISLPSRSRKKAERLTETPESEWVDVFNGIYNATLLEHHIKDLPIHKKDPQYLSLKEITRQAMSFCQAFQVPYEAGFKSYIELGILILTPKFSLYRLKAAGDRIAALNRDILSIADDPTPELTKKMEEAWRDAMLKYAGFRPTISIPSDKYVCLIYAKKDAEELKANYNDWVNAQFEKWSYLKSMPEFSQLYGDNAKLIYKIYIGKESQGDAGYDKIAKSGKKIPLKEDELKALQRQSPVQAGVSGTGSSNNG